MDYNRATTIIHKKLLLGEKLGKHFVYRKHGKFHTWILPKARVTQFRFTPQHGENTICMTVIIGAATIPLYFSDIRQMNWDVLDMAERGCSIEEEFVKTECQIRVESDGRLEVSFANDLHELPFFMSFTCDKIFTDYYHGFEKECADTAYRTWNL